MSAHRQSRLTVSRGRGLVPQFVVVVALVAGSALALTAGQTATAGIVPTVELDDAAVYSVLGGQTVTNTNPSVLGQSVGVSPGSAVVGFPPGLVQAPGTVVTDAAVNLEAQSDLTVAYNDADTRDVEFFQTNPDLVGQTLTPGVYAATDMAALRLSGDLVLDGGGDERAVFIFQTDSTLITDTASTIRVTNGALECNVFWQVGSSATLGSDSSFVGTILALTSITLETNAVVHGRALARNGSVTLDDNDVTEPNCIPVETTTTTSVPGDTTSTTTPPGGDTTPGTTPGGDTTPGSTPGGDTTPGTTPGGDTTPTTTPAGITVPPPIGTDVIPTSTFPFTPTDVTLPETGTGTLVAQSSVGFAVLLIGLLALVAARRRQPV